MNTTQPADLGLEWAENQIKDKPVRTAAPSPIFWDLWREHKIQLKQAGFRVAKTGDDFIVIDETDQDPEATAETIAESQATDAPPDYSIPAPGGLEYLPYQRAGVKALTERPAALLADDMGLGKTVQICGLLNRLIEAPPAPGAFPTVLIVVPASLKINWRNELSKWLVISRRIAVINGGNEQIPADPDIVVINYDVLAKHADRLLDRTWGCVVFDEAHYLKNPKAARTKYAFKIEAQRRYALTGTPIPNRPIEIQPVLAYLAPDDFGGKNAWYKFADRYCDGHRGRFGYDASGASNLGELRQRLRSSIMIRREKAEVLADLPAKRRQVIVLPADKYADVLRAEREADRVDEALAEALAMIESGGSVDFRQMSEVRHDTAMAKVPAVIDHVLAIDQPCVVFAHHHDVMAALAGGLKADGRSVVMLHGAHTSEQRQQAVDDFQQGRADVFIGGLKSAGVGITLTRASIAVFSELDWTPAVVTQAEDRIHRIGQNDAVLCQHLVIDRSLDHRIVELLVEKQGVISAVMKQHSKREIAKIAQRVTLEGIAGELIAAGKFKIRPPSPAVERETLNVAPIFDALNSAIDSGLKWPSLRFDGMAISMATKGKNAGHLYVKRGPDYNDEYLGKVDPSGIFYPSRDCTNADCDRLREIAADFQGQLEAHGIDTGVCGCCGRELTNPESVRLGIGPFCRQRFGF